MRYDLYVAGRGDRCRYVLGQSGSEPLFVVALNPSTATREKSDTTVAKVEHIARRAGCDGFVLFNLYPLRATHLRDLPQRADSYVYRRNLAEFRTRLACAEHATVWAAWGEHVRARSYLVAAVRAIVGIARRRRAHWVHFGPLTRSGHPRHPSRASYRWSFAPLDADAYLGQLR
jgi:hypothetical protein